MELIVYADRGDEKNTVEKIKFQWTKSILEQTGLDFNDCFPESDEPTDLTIDNKKNIRKILSDNKIEVIDEGEGCKIYIQEELIAEFYQPSYKLNFDNSKVSRKDRWFVEIKLNFWSVFD
jgi:hypothetical protein